MGPPLFVVMRSVHCPNCTDLEGCRDSHLYVIQLKEEIGENYVKKSTKGYLYVGQTGVSVEKRGKMNFTRKDGTIVDPEALYLDRKKPEDEQKWPEDGEWVYEAQSIPKIRAYFLKYRPDLVLPPFENPHKFDKNDKGKIYRYEGKLADKLANKGWRIINGVSWKKMKKRRNNSS